MKNKTNTLRTMTTVAPLTAVLLLAGTTVGQNSNPTDRDRNRDNLKQVEQSKAAMYALSSNIRGKDIYNRQGEEIGTVSDLIVDVRTGKAQFAIVSFGGFLGIGSDSVAVPLKAMSWERGNERFVLPTTPERLKSAPDFDSENWDQLSDRNWLERTRQVFGDLPDMDDRADERYRDENRRPADQRAQGNRFDRYMLASTLADATIIGNDGEEFGSISDVVIDRNSGHVGFVTFETGGVLGIGSETRIAPWEALERVQENEFRVALAGSRNESAPKVTNDGIAELSTPAASRGIYAYYGVESRWQDGQSGGMNGTVYASADSILGTDLVDRQGEAFGSIDDMVVGFRNGSTPYAVVSHGGVVGIGSDTVAVPLRALSWDATEDRYSISTTRRQFGNAPDFDSGNWDTLDSDDWRTQTQRAFGVLPHDDRAQERREGERDRRDGSEDRMNPNLDAYILLSDLKGMTLVGSDGQEIGEIETVVLDRNSGHIGFVTMKVGQTLGMGGETVVIPWEAMRRVQEGQIRVNKASTTFESAPRIEADRLGDLNDRSYRNEIYAYYQVSERARPDGAADRDRRERDQRDRDQRDRDQRDRDRNPGSGR